MTSQNLQFFDEQTSPLLTGNRHDAEAMKSLNLFLPMSEEHGAGFIKNVVAIIMLLFYWSATHTTILCRHSFGIRYISITRFLVAGIMTSLIRFPITLMFGGVGILDYVWMWSITSAYVIHYWQARKRLRNKETLWHSNSFGISHFEPLLGKLAKRFNHLPFPQLDDYFLHRVAEPFAFFLLALLIRPFDLSVSYIIMFGALGHLIHANLSYSHLQGRLLDIIDAQIESRFFQISMDGAHKSTTAGYQAPVRLADDGLTNLVEGRVKDTLSKVAATVSETLAQPTTQTPSTVHPVRSPEDTQTTETATKPNEPEGGAAVKQDHGSG